MTVAASENVVLCRDSESAEIWLPVAGFPGYFVSDRGYVRSHWGRGAWNKQRGPRLIGNVWNDGYRRVWLYAFRDGHLDRKQWKVIAVHQLVLETFVGPCPPGQMCRHLNDIPLDNRLANLAWGTRLENTADAKANGRLGPYKVSAEMAAAIRHDRESMTLGQLREKYGLTVVAIARTLRPKRPRKTRKDLGSRRGGGSKEDANEGASEGLCLSPLSAREGCTPGLTSAVGSTPLSDHLRPEAGSRAGEGDGRSGGDVREGTRSQCAPLESVPVALASGGLGASSCAPDSAGPSPTLAVRPC